MAANVLLAPCGVMAPPTTPGAPAPTPALAPAAAREIPTQQQEPWEEVAARTKKVAQKWRALHASEEIRAEEAEQGLRLALMAIRRAEQERDAASKSAAAAAQAATAARQELSKWRARSAAQTASRVFLELEETRAVVATREAQVVQLQRALMSAQQQLESQRHAHQREDEVLKSGARERLEGLMLKREEAAAEMRELRAANEKLRAELSRQMADCPPGTLEAAKLHASRQEAYVEQLEKRCAMLRRQSATWKERTRGAVASERLTQLHSGAASVPPRGGAAGAAGDAEGEASEDAVAASFWRQEAEVERARVRGFQHAVWESDHFSQVQKQRIMAWLREPPDPADPYLTAAHEAMGLPVEAQGSPDARAIGGGDASY